MKKRQLLIVKLESEHDDSETQNENEFIRNMKQAILLSLLKNKKITQLQYDRCMESIHTLDS